MEITEVTIQDRLNYWRNHDLKSGWTQSAGGPCCDKCRMTTAKDPLQALCGCRDPFQINCECHIPTRRAFRDSMVMELEALCARTEVAQKPEAVDEFRCALSTIAGIAKANGSNALHEISCTALAGIERLKAMAEETIPSPLARKSDG